MVLVRDRKSAHLIPLWQDCDVVGTLKLLKEMTDASAGEKRGDSLCCESMALCSTPLLRYLLQRRKIQD